ncbi:MAG TPA: prepilin-type N-terminal cleavage/methylation domain-containing protein [Cerasibacillus sp.]|uniref:type IV pilus modification PilV family protein n=1 Tax=Cerasibacillus sp. TaxID=2498711 RepID=UPI002F429891
MNKQERGFTLLEVAAALLIISFIFIGILSLMQSTKKLSSENIDQLVMTSFATGSLKRFLDNPTLYMSGIQEDQTCKKIKPINCHFEKMSFTEPIDISSYNQQNIDSNLYHLKANDEDYYLRFTLTQDEHEKRKELINVIAFVSKDSNFKKGRVKVEGYLSYAENTEAPKN